MSCGTDHNNNIRGASQAVNGPAATGGVVAGEATMPTSQPTTIDDVRDAFPPRSRYARYFQVGISSRPNSYYDKTDPWSTFTASLEAGRNYMVGKDVPMDQFMRSHRSPLNAWQQAAFQWAQENPEKMLTVEANGKDWLVYRRGEYVEFYLPHQDAGGENVYITQNGKIKYHVNED